MLKSGIAFGQFRHKPDFKGREYPITPQKYAHKPLVGRGCNLLVKEQGGHGQHHFPKHRDRYQVAKGKLVLASGGTFSPIKQANAHQRKKQHRANREFPVRLCLWREIMKQGQHECSTRRDEDEVLEKRFWVHILEKNRPTDLGP